MKITIPGVFQSKSKQNFISILSGSQAVRVLSSVMDQDLSLRPGQLQRLASEAIWRGSTIGPIVVQLNQNHADYSGGRKTPSLKIKADEASLQVRNGVIQIQVLRKIMQEYEIYLNQVSVLISFEMSANEPVFLDAELIKSSIKSYSAEAKGESANIISPLLSEDFRLPKPNERSIISRLHLGADLEQINDDLIVSFFNKLPEYLPTIKRILLVETAAISDLKRDFLLARPVFLISALRIYLQTKGKGDEDLFWNWLRSFNFNTEVLHEPKWEFLVCSDGVVEQSKSVAEKVFELLKIEFEKSIEGLVSDEHNQGSF
jgi:hypothetical protein